MKVFFFLYGLSREDFTFFFERTWMISAPADIRRVIERHVFRIGDAEDGRTRKTAILEALLFLEAFLARGLGGPDDIEWVHERNFLICNDELYRQEGTTYRRVEGDVVFATSRDSWKHPFFRHAARFLGQRVVLLRPNPEAQTFHADKLNAIARLWSLREACVGDIIVPLLRNKHEDHVRLLLEFARRRLGDRIVVKNNFGVEGEKVRALDLGGLAVRWDRIAAQVKQDFFDVGVRGVNGAYLVRHYRIEKEFRLYFTWRPDTGIRLHSVKNRENRPRDGGSLFTQPDFTRESLHVVWHYQHPDDFCREERDALALCHRIIPLLGLEIGVLELCREDDGSIRFLEVNPLGGALMHRGPDEAMMRDYYLTMWSGQLDRLCDRQMPPLG